MTFGACMYVIVHEVFEVKGGGLCFRPPKTQLPPLPCYLFPALVPLPTHLQLDCVSHLPIHLKTQNTYWDPIWGWGRGAWVGPRQGWKTQQQEDEEKKVAVKRGERWSVLRPPTGDGFKWLFWLPLFFPFSASFCPFFLFTPPPPSLMLCSLGWHWDCEVQLAWPRVLQRGRGSNQTQLLCVNKEVCGGLVSRTPPHIHHHCFSLTLSAEAKLNF